MTVTFQGVEYDDRHGGPFDRGDADSYYGRKFYPHYFVRGTNTSPMIRTDEMTEEEIAAYRAGYEYNEQNGFKKDWG